MKTIYRLSKDEVLEIIKDQMEADYGKVEKITVHLTIGEDRYGHTLGPEFNYIEVEVL